MRNYCSEVSRVAFEEGQGKQLTKCSQKRGFGGGKEKADEIISACFPFDSKIPSWSSKRCLRKPMATGFLDRSRSWWLDTIMGSLAISLSSPPLAARELGAMPTWVH